MNTIATLHVDQQPYLTGTVKWFDANRGFGFVAIPGHKTDFLLHQNVLQGFGRSSIAEGSSVEFAYQATENGLKVTEVFAVTPPIMDVTKTPETPPDTLLEDLLPARVKWFDPNKGYGFVNAFGDDEDIFIGIAVLRKSMLSSVSAGDALCIQVAETDGRKSVFTVQDWC